MEHVPVLLNEVCELMDLAADAIVIDATFGRGGHARGLLAGLGNSARYLALDRDQDAVAAAEKMAQLDARIEPVHGCAADIELLSTRQGLAGKVHAVLADLGVSSPQVDQASRGFSFLVDGPLDMRMDVGQTLTAASWIHDTNEKEMARVFFEFGEERFSRRIARAIVRCRKTTTIDTTAQLADIVSRAHPAWERHRHPATRVFQAIRIAVNDELGQIRRALVASARVLKPGGRMAFISFHSLEDRIVKRFIRDASRPPDPFAPTVSDDAVVPRLKRISGAVRANDEEVASNHRARSAVLRVAERLVQDAL